MISMRQLFISIVKKQFFLKVIKINMAFIGVENQQMEGQNTEEQNTFWDRVCGCAAYTDSGNPIYKV